MSLSRSILPLLLLLVASCNVISQHSEVVDVDPSGWVLPAEVRFEIVDTTQYMDLQLVLRCLEQPNASAVRLLVSTQAPDGVVWREHFTLYPSPQMDFPTTLEQEYRRRVRFSQQGEYCVTLQPLQSYKGISAAGVSMSLL